MIDKESCAGDLPIPNLPQVDDGNTVGDAALGLLAIASFIMYKVGRQAPKRFGKVWVRYGDQSLVWIAATKCSQ